MADSEWESIRKKTRNRIRYGVGIGIPVLLVAGFLFYNNRDLLGSSVQIEEAVKQSDSALVKSLPDSIPGKDPDDHKVVKQESKDSVLKKTDSVDVQVEPEIKKAAGKKAIDEPAGTTAEVIDTPEAAVMPEAILELVSISCRTADQNGPTLSLSVALKSAQQHIDTKILGMRDELRVLIQNAVRSKEISTLSKEQLKTEIIQSVNKYIGKETFNDLKFTEFKVEKVIKK